ncbi:heterokaryon incompatibility protein-domain-containing protein [Dactylonectria macrodidyma]|uniref:Heterokaryon incompatibility protein-domain-containing protein n=1 Tax=Dactylonectria macrodidyma TaxID=307937 RepID=A0A9P9E350_9HYPO|nr:heterokaryon incompatibility protein-domain-containing protein [Dactylonectria macrodidyma]
MASFDAQQPVYNAVYPPADTSRDQIRLMRLHPAIAFEDPIRIDLFTKDLSNPIEYDALSYVWGSAVSESTATVNGTAMVPTKNLDKALRHIRRPETARVLWIDAVCINQRVTEERNHQVQMMGQIYSSALRVVIWLGSEAGGSAAVISAIRAGADPQQLISTLRFRFELRALCSRPWFSRIWVVQEVALAKQDPIVTCGQAFYPYSYGISDGVWNIPYSILHIPYGPSVFHTYGIRPEEY